MQIQGGRSGRSLLLGSALVSFAAAGIAKAEIADAAADGVLGQSSYTDAVALPIGPATFGKPSGLAIDRVNNRVYVSDRLNHRVLGWGNADALADGAAADIVIGQPDFFSYGCNHSMEMRTYPPHPPTLDSVCDPEGLAVDNDGNLYVADGGNSRVLIFVDPFATDQVADLVLGQADGANGCDTTHFRGATGVAVDGSGNVYVVDSLNDRVLEFDTPFTNGTTADRVYGQADFTSGTFRIMYSPEGVVLDPSGKLYVGAQQYVYEFDNPLTGSTHPSVDRVIGSNGNGCYWKNETASSMCFPVGVATDSAGRLYVADALNSRVLEFDSPLTVNQAARVFGQADFGPPPGAATAPFCSRPACNFGGASASSLCLGTYHGSQSNCGIDWFAAVAVDAADALWVADGFNNRVLRYLDPLGSDALADVVLGQPTMLSTRSPVTTLNAPSIGLDESAFRALVVDTNNNRILVYADLGEYGRDRPEAVIGQPDTSSTGCNTGGLSASSLCYPTAAIADGGALWIADTGNNRVLRIDNWYDYDWTSHQWVLKRAADHVFGQPDFTSNSCNLGPSGLCAPQGIALDAHGYVYIIDTGNNRILVDQNPLSNDNRAEFVFGQPDFNTRDCTPGAGGAAKLCDPRGVAVRSHVDPWGIDQGDDLYVADRGNNRVVAYTSVMMKASGAAADKVFGQGGNMDSGSCNQGAAGLCAPSAVALDRAGHLLVADTDNNRVLEYDDPLSDSATRVFGQTTFTDNLCNGGNAAPTDTTLCQPAGVVASGAREGNLVIADGGNNRILRYEAPYCIENFSLTAANRSLKDIRTKPLHTVVKIAAGSGGDTVSISDRLTWLEKDGFIDEDYEPLFTLATDSTFSTGVVVHERVPQWEIDQVRETASGGLWRADLTDFTSFSQGINFYQLRDRYIDKPPYRNRIAYKATAIGEDLSGFTASHAWFRGQFGSTCFTTELQCALKNGKRTCRPAKPLQ